MDRDPASILDILHYGRLVIGFVEGRSLIDMGTDHQLRLAVLHGIAVFGEAANRLSPEFRESRPDIPWPQIISMRNRIMHGYEGVQPEAVWNVATIHLPQLVSQLEPPTSLVEAP